MEDGSVLAVAGEASGERSDVRYRCVPPPPVQEQSARARRRPRDVRARRFSGAMPDSGVLRPEVEQVDLQSRLEACFAEFFDGIVSEWNPCYDDSGRCRYYWDEEIGAHDVVFHEEEAEKTSERRPGSSSPVRSRSV